MSWRPSLLVRFGAVSLVLVAALGLVTGIRLNQAVKARTLSDAIRSAQVAAEVGLRPQLKPADLQRGFVPLDPSRLTDLQGAFAGAVSPSNGVVRIKVWNSQHWIVFSDNPRLVGRWFPSDPLLAAALTGKTGSQITDLSGREELSERNFGRLLAVYLPIRVGADGQFTSDTSGRVIGSFEIYLPYAPIASAMAEDGSRLLLTLGIGLVVLYLALFRLVSGASRRLRGQAVENKHQALHDALTGLPNRVLLHDRIDQAVRASRRSETRTAVMLLDLDRFKVINDTLGHRHGDIVLRQVGARYRDRLREVDTVARLGGDEFALVLGDLNAEVDVVGLGREMETLLEAPIEIDGLEFEIRGSIGVAVFPVDGDNADTLLQKADVAMYVAKRGHSRCEAYRAEIDQYSPERLELAAQVRAGLDNDEFVLVYQPKLDLAAGRITGVEALVRWQHPLRGLLPPVEFLPVVENTELIRPLTLRVLDVALAQARVWLDAGLGLAVAVNLSARSLGDRDLVDVVRSALERHHVDPRWLVLELTESAVLDDPDQARTVLGELHDLGIKVAIDDFGTGYASLAYVSSLPVDSLKIDRSFVLDVTTGGQGASIVQFSIQLGRSLGIAVVAEGIEDAETLARLTELGCDEAQGYYLSRPLTPLALDAWFATSDYPPAGLPAGLAAGLPAGLAAGAK